MTDDDMRSGRGALDPSSSVDGSGRQHSTEDLARRIAIVTAERDALAEEVEVVKRKLRTAAAEAVEAKNLRDSLSRQLAETKAGPAAAERRSIAVLIRRLKAMIVTPARRSRAVRARQAESIHLVRQSHLFDAAWYLATYADVAEAGLDPARHYVLEGGFESRDPGPQFSSSRYLKTHRDVAQMGVNPLVHYLEHGLAEGRHLGTGKAAAPRRSREDFGPPAPIFSIAPAPVEPTTWTRHYELTADRPSVRIGDVVIGYHADGPQSDLAAAIHRFTTVSGVADARGQTVSEARCVVQPALVMLDAWFASQSRFQARWSLDGQSFVVRGYQRDDQGVVRLIGEGLVSSSLDVIEFLYANPFFPILFVACRPDGACVSAATLFFPSLCRGGRHYSEMVAMGANGRTGPLLLGERYATQLEAIRSDAVPALINTIRVDMAGADGTRPLFQEDCQHWLSSIMGVVLTGSSQMEGERGTALDFLCRRLEEGPLPTRPRTTGARLVLPSDTVPTIASMVAAAGGEGDCAQANYNLSLVVAGSDPSKAAIAISVPSAWTSPVAPHSDTYPLDFARLEGADGAPGDLHAAIRFLVRPSLAESELLQPCAQPLAIFPLPDEPPPVSIVIEPSLWSIDALEAGLAALAGQRGNGSALLFLIGPVDNTRRIMIEATFSGRTTYRADDRQFVSHVPDGHVLHVGPEVILHDPRTLGTLQGLLQHAASASCPLLTCVKEGKHWAVAVADAGKAATATTETGIDDVAQVAAKVWRSTFPVMRQPVSLWATHASVLRAGPPHSSPHLCCSWLSASFWERPPAQQPTLSLPPGRAAESIQIEALFG